MIIIIIIIQYFIQITHTDDFPSTGTRVALYKELTLISGMPFVPVSHHYLKKYEFFFNMSECMEEVRLKSWFSTEFQKHQTYVH